MDKLWFSSDYMEGAHPRLLQRLTDTNLEQTPGYGRDEYCESARSRIREACACPQAGVEFLVGGTQTNATLISALLRPYQGVIAPFSGHINDHEAGAIEQGGHKVLTLPHRSGKITAEQIDELCRAFPTDEPYSHAVIPGMVFLSQPTEYGTLYSLEELGRIREACLRHGLLLYVDGARLAYALCSPENDVTLADLARLADAFYIGGTKCGCLMGEAAVLPNPSLLPHFFTIIKQHGALLAKGRLLGLQFDELFRDGLYLQLGRDAVVQAERIQEAVLRGSGRLLERTHTNQVFLVLTNRQADALAERVVFSVRDPYDAEHSVVRLVTGWATRPEDVDALCRLLEAF